MQHNLPPETETHILENFLSKSVFFLINNLHLVKFLSYRDWWDFDAVEGSRCHYPQPTSQRRVVLEALEEKDEERALQVQDLDGWEWIWPNSAPVVKN